jgi:hypothetical protein
MSNVNAAIKGLYAAMCINSPLLSKEGWPGNKVNTEENLIPGRGG